MCCTVYHPILCCGNNEIVYRDREYSYKYFMFYALMYVCFIMFIVIMKKIIIKHLFYYHTK